MTKRDKLRLKFKENGLSYESIGSKDIGKLWIFIEQELSVFDNNGFTMILKKTRKSDYEYNKDGSLKKFYIRCKGIINDGAVEYYHFKNREAISFDEGIDEFIGFCGWADSTNSKPFLNAFDKWIDYLINK